MLTEMCGFDPAPGYGTHDLNYAIYFATVHLHSLGSRETFILNTLKMYLHLFKIHFGNGFCPC